MVKPHSLSPEFCSRNARSHWFDVGLRRIAVSALLLLLFFSSGFAQEKALTEAGSTATGGAETAFYSRYVSRGISLSDGPVFQPSAWVTLDDLTLSYFGNYVLTREKQQGRFNEADISLAWRRGWNRFIIEPTFTLYAYPNTEDQSQYETGLTLARDFGPWRLSTFNSVTFAVSEKASYYGEMILAYRLGILEKVSFTGKLTVSWPEPAAIIEGILAYDLSGNWSLSFRAGYGVATSATASSDNNASREGAAKSIEKAGYVGLGFGFKL